MTHKPKKGHLPRRAPRKSIATVEIPKETGGFSIMELTGRHVRAVLGFAMVTSSIVVFVVEKLRMKVVGFSKEDLWMHLTLVLGGWALMDWISFKEFAGMVLAKIPWGAAQKASAKLVNMQSGE